MRSAQLVGRNTYSLRSDKTSKDDKRNKMIHFNRFEQTLCRISRAISLEHVGKGGRGDLHNAKRIKLELCIEINNAPSSQRMVGLVYSEVEKSVYDDAYAELCLAHSRHAHYFCKRSGLNASAEKGVQLLHARWETGMGCGVQL